MLESSSCQLIYKESLDICFNSVIHTILSSQKAASGPLASMLPKFKAIASALLPTTAVTCAEPSALNAPPASGTAVRREACVVSAEAEAVTSFHALDVFCIQLFHSLSAADIASSSS